MGVPPVVLAPPGDAHPGDIAALPGGPEPPAGLAPPVGDAPECAGARGRGLLKYTPCRFFDPTPSGQACPPPRPPGGTTGKPTKPLL